MARWKGREGVEPKEEDVGKSRKRKPEEEERRKSMDCGTQNIFLPGTRKEEKNTLASGDGSLFSQNSCFCIQNDQM
jgi:hypothetical protein